MTERRFPIIACRAITSVPWALVEPLRRRVLWRYGQSLESLAERGGLTPAEFVATHEALSLTEYRALDRKSAEARLGGLIAGTVEVKRCL